MIKKARKKLFTSTLVMLLPATPAAAKAITPIPLVAVKNNSDLYIQACRLSTIECNDKTSVWKAKEIDNTLYIIDSSLKLAILKKDNNSYSQQGYWDFSSLPQEGNDIIDDDLEKSDTYIYPALYPLNKNKQTIALVSTWSASYSGGYRSKEYADFIMINDDGSYQTIFKNVYFSLSEMIRACFNDKERTTKPHCHDEKWVTLKIKITGDKKEHYTWKFIEKTYNYPSSSAKVHTKTKKYSAPAFVI